MINLEKVSEGVDYNLAPGEKGDDRWVVEIIRGDHKGKAFMMEDVQINDEEMRMKLTVLDVESGEELDSTNRDVQLYAGAVMEDIIRNGIASGAIEYGQDSDQ